MSIHVSFYKNHEKLHYYTIMEKIQKIQLIFCFNYDLFFFGTIFQVVRIEFKFQCSN